MPRQQAGAAPDTVWTARAGRGFTGPLALDDSTLYAGGLDRKVYAVRLADGSVRWASRLQGMILGGVRRSGDTVFAASARPQGRVSALARATGKQLWRTSTGEIGAPLALLGDAVVALTTSGEAIALERRTGRARWRRRVGVARVAAVAAEDGAIVVATTDSLLRLDPRSGKVTLGVRSPGTVISDWVRWRGLLVAGSTDSQVVAVRPSDLRTEWTARVDAPVMSTPAARSDTLFVASRAGTLYVIPPSEHPAARRVLALSWPVTAPVAVARDEILLGGADGTIRAFRADGSERWRVRVWRPVELAPVVLSDGLLAVGGNGDLHRYRR